GDKTFCSVFILHERVNVRGVGRRVANYQRRVHVTGSVGRADQVRSEQGHNTARREVYYSLHLFLGFGLRLGLGFPRGVSSERKSFLLVRGQRRLLFGVRSRGVVKLVAFGWQKEMR